MTKRSANPIQHWQIDPYEFDLYKGEWDASTNSPELVSESRSKGEWYRVSVGGGNYNKGDDVWFDGSDWVRRESGNAKSTDLEVINANEETNINHYLAPDHLHLLEAYCVGGRGDNSEVHAAEVIATDPAIPGVTVYADQQILW